MTWKRLQLAFAIDLRSLALLRILASLAVIINVSILWPDAGVWLSDAGLYGRSDAMGAITSSHLSLYFLSGATWYAKTLLIVTLAAALAMLMGWHTRVATLVTWALMVSLANRIPALTTGADTQLCLLLFWSLFLPLGERFSVDSALRKTGHSTPNSYFSVATVALLLQVAYLYFFGALLKTGAPWRETFDAVYYAMSAIELTTPAAFLLAQRPALARALTAYVFYLELFAILFLFTPYLLTRARLFVLPQLIAMHIGFAVFLSIAIFPLVSISGLLAFVPTAVWDKTLNWWNNRPRRKGISIYYDRDCGFCLKTCLIFRELGLPPDTPVQPAQDHPVAKALLDQENSWVVRRHDGQLLTKWKAVAYVWRRSPLFCALGWLFMAPGMHRLGESIYGLIAGARPGLGRLSARWLPWHEKPVYRPARGTSIVLAFLASLVLMWNLGTMRSEHLDFHFPDALKPLMSATRLTQHWNMFAPQPLLVSRWIVVEGRNARGDTADLLFDRETPPSHARPGHGFAAYPNYRWRKFHSRSAPEQWATRLARYYCNRTSQASAVGMDTVTIAYYRQGVTAPGTVPQPVERQSWLVYSCIEGAAVHPTPSGQDFASGSSSSLQDVRAAWTARGVD